MGGVLGDLHDPKRVGYSNLKQRLRDEWRTLRTARPGRRFVNAHARSRPADKRRPIWVRAVVLLAAFGLFLIGLVLAVMPGPAVLFYALAAALVASQFYAAARWLDISELWVRRWMRGPVGRWRAWRSGRLTDLPKDSTVNVMQPSDDSNLLTFASAAEGLSASTPLNNGVAMPWFGLGVYQMGDDATTAGCVREAIRQGYRSIDTASLYGNERGVGIAIRESGVPRDALFVTTKLWNDDQRADRAEAAFEESLEQLGLDYVDLYLIHWPVPGKFVASWKVLERLYQSGKARAIGVSNFLVEHLEELDASATIVPAVNQIEFHPYLRSTPLLEYCRRRSIQVMAWSPLMQGAVLGDPNLRRIATKHRKTPAQVVLRWDLQNGIVTIPKSVRAERMAENADIFDFILDPSDMRAIDALDRGQRSGADPKTFRF